MIRLGLAASCFGYEAAPGATFTRKLAELFVDRATDHRKVARKNAGRDGGMSAQFGDERLARLYRYWWQKRGDRAAPHRADLSPAEIPDLLPIMNLLDVSWEPLTFRHRLVGTELVEWMKRDVTGKMVNEALYGRAAGVIIDGLSRVATEVKPYRRRSRLDWQGREWQAVESLELPLIDDAGRTVMLLRGAAHSTAGPDFPDRVEFTPLGPPEK